MDMETIRDQIPELKINAVTETNAEMNLLSAKSSGDVNLSAQLGAVGKYGSLSSGSTTSTSAVFKRVSRASIVATYPVVSIIPIDKFKFSIIFVIIAASNFYAWQIFCMSRNSELIIIVLLLICSNFRIPHQSINRNVILEK